jgi:hypothetical protein
MPTYVPQGLSQECAATMRREAAKAYRRAVDQRLRCEAMRTRHHALHARLAAKFTRHSAKDDR